MAGSCGVEDQGVTPVPRKAGRAHGTGDTPALLPDPAVRAGVSVICRSCGARWQEVAGVERTAGGEDAAVSIVVLQQALHALDEDRGGRGVDVAALGRSRRRPACRRGLPRVTLDESVNMAFLVVLESMTPAERVAFILHDVFRYSFNEVADIVGRSPQACRQLASSARRRIRSSEARPAPSAQQAGLVRDFKQAWEAKDVGALIGLLDPDATTIADGGGLVSATLHPIEGAEDIARVLVEIADRAPTMTLLERTVNGQPGLVAQLDGVTVTVMAFEVAGGRIPAHLGGAEPGEAPPLDDELISRPVPHVSAGPHAPQLSGRSCASAGSRSMCLQRRGTNRENPGGSVGLCRRRPVRCAGAVQAVLPDRSSQPSSRRHR
jgi:hypothetical protein